MEYCQDHIQIKSDIEVIKTTVVNLDKRINGSIDDIQKHISAGQNWRIGIIGVAVMLILQIISFAYLFGHLASVVDDNTKEIAMLRSNNGKYP